jgi:hypothetical protein
MEGCAQSQMFEQLLLGHLRSQFCGSMLRRTHRWRGSVAARVPHHHWRGEVDIRYTLT